MITFERRDFAIGKFLKSGRWVDGRVDQLFASAFRLEIRRRKHTKSMYHNIRQRRTGLQGRCDASRVKQLSH